MATNARHNDAVRQPQGLKNIHDFIELNRTLASDPRWKRISRSKPPLEVHEEWAGVKDKPALLEGMS